MERPEWIKCIRQTHEEKKRLSWCGKDITFGFREWAFVDIDHAAYNNLSKGRLLPCPDCVKVIAELLLTDPYAKKEEKDG